MYLNSSSNSYEKKYLKYKNKYKALKNQFGGAKGTLHGGAKGTLHGGDCDPLPNPEEEDLATTHNLLDLCPEERITIQNKCYEVRGLHRWIIEGNNKKLPFTQTDITDEEKQRLSDAYGALYSRRALPSQPLVDLTVVTREKLIQLYPGLEYETSINLSGRGCISIHVDALYDLPYLEVLNLKNNQISILEPSLFRNLPRLKRLILSTNQISVLPPGIFNNLNLEILFLDHNQISVLPPNIFDKLQYSLKILYLNHNLITVLQPNIFNNLLRLEEIYLHNNQISVLQPRIFNKEPDMFGDVLHLEHLDLSNNQISVIQPNTFKYLRNLEKLFLTNNPIIVTPKIIIL